MYWAGGKSAILTALCVAFGSRAKGTQRASSLKDFIKTGCRYLPNFLHFSTFLSFFFLFFCCVDCMCMTGILFLSFSFYSCFLVSMDILPVSIHIGPTSSLSVNSMHYLQNIRGGECTFRSFSVLNAWFGLVHLVDRRFL